MKRLPNETFEQYKERRKNEQNETATKLKGTLKVVGRRIIEKDGKTINIQPEGFQGTFIKRKNISSNRKEDKNEH
jgi:hypothetical protein